MPIESRLPWYMSNICIFLKRSGTRSPDELALLQSLLSNVRVLYEKLYKLPIMGSYSCRPPVKTDRAKRQARFVITAEQLQFLRSEFNNWSQTADDLGVSRQTIYNRRRELGFSLEFKTFTDISNVDLDSAVQEELSAFSRTGKTNLIGCLRARGIYVQ